MMTSSTPKGKIKRGLSFDDNTESGWKSPFKLQTPIVHTKEIYLHDWWLMRPEEGQGIRVGGFSIRKEGLETSFCSALIKERHDNSTIEASDGFTIFISGQINRSFTEQNGFSPEVCNYFVNGFPLDWDDFTTKHADEGTTDRSHSFSLDSFQNMSFFQKQDFLLSAPGMYDENAISKHLFNDLVEKLKPASATSKDDTIVNNLRICTRSKTGKLPKLKANK